MTIVGATILDGVVAHALLGSMQNSFASLVIGLLLEEEMRRKSEKNEKMNGFLGALYGSTSKFRKFKWNRKCHKCGIYGHFARECTRPHPSQGNSVVQQTNLVQNEMLHLF